MTSMHDTAYLKNYSNIKTRPYCLKLKFKYLDFKTFKYLIVSHFSEKPGSVLNMTKIIISNIYF